MNLVEPLHHWAQKDPQKIALVEGSGKGRKSLSYTELLERVEQTHQVFQSHGLSEQSRVLLMQPVGIDLYVLLLACFSGGITAVIIDPGVSPQVMKHACDIAMPDAFIGPAKAHALKLKFPAIRNIKKSFHTSGWVPSSSSLSSAKGERVSLKSLSRDHPALITFTSGSTGLPKAASRSHGFLIEQHHAIAHALDHKEAETELITLPVFGLASLASGMTSVIADTNLKFPAKANSTAVHAQCIKENVTRCAASPAFFKRLHADGLFPPFRNIYTGGAPVFPSFLEVLTESYEALKITTVYGSTEAEPISHQHFKEVTQVQHKKMEQGRGLLVGKPVSEIALSILSEGAQEMPTGEIGEITVTGEHVLKGYLNAEKDAETKIKREGEIWHRTGDTGYLDEEGNLWLTGRSNAILESPEGKAIYPFSIETVAMTQREVKACAVVKHKDKITLCYEGTVNLDQLKHLTSPLGIEHYIHLEKIPMDSRHNAKVDYPYLKKLLENEG